MTSLVARPLQGSPVMLSVEDGQVTEVCPLDVDQGDLPVVAPALVDLQVNGYGGIDFNADDLTVDQVYEVVAQEWSQGVGTLCPTLITGPEERIVRSLSVIAEARRRCPLVAHSVPCVHVEGPSLSPEDGPRGAHDVRFIRDADLAEFHRWQACSDGLVGIVTIAPESPRATEYIEAISKVGVVVAIGHTAASGEQIRAAVRSGARMSTHLGNGAHTVLPRHPNYIWTQLADDRLVASFIADGQHLPSDTLSAMLRAKGLDRSILVSDSVSMAGMPPGDYQPSVGGAVTVEADGRVRLAGTPYLAGSGFSLLACVNWATANVLLAPEVALLLATVNPARMLGHETRAVSDPLRPCSDFVILAEGASGFVVQCTVINGRVVFPGSRLIDR